jgi:hypothetical protein
MKILEVNIKDGRGIIEVVVADSVVSSRLIEYFKWAEERDLQADLLLEQINSSKALEPSDDR